MDSSPQGGKMEKLKTMSFPLSRYPQRGSWNWYRSCCSIYSASLTPGDGGRGWGGGEGNMTMQQKWHGEEEGSSRCIQSSSSSSSSAFFPDGSAPGVTASITEKQRKKLHFLPSKETQSTWKLFYNSSTTVGNGLWTVKFIIKKNLNCTPCLLLPLHPLEAVHPLRHTFVHQAATSLSPLVTYRSFFCSLKPRRRRGGDKSLINGKRERPSCNRRAREGEWIEVERV